jgi:hypothetical protein
MSVLGSMIKRNSRAKKKEKVKKKIGKTGVLATRLFILEKKTG